MLLKLVNVSKIYQMDSHEVKALQNASLEIKKKDFIAIMGPSGSGKSTLMHIIGCLDRPTSGEYYLEGKKTKKLTDDELAKIRNKKIGFVFQTFNLLPRVTALNNVELPLLYAGLKRKQRHKVALEKLKQLGLEERVHHFSNQLSGGQQQRVAIARALVNNPLIILADEPTGNVDTKAGTEIMKILQELNKGGHTIIVVTHDAYVAKFAKKIIRIKDGAIQ